MALKRVVSYFFDSNLARLRMQNIHKVLLSITGAWVHAVMLLVTGEDLIVFQARCSSELKSQYQFHHLIKISDLNFQFYSHY